MLLPDCSINTRDVLSRCSAADCPEPDSVCLSVCLSYAVEGMSDGELQEKALGVAKHTLSGKSDLERAAVLHQHIGRRAMGDMVIETFEPSPGETAAPLHLSAKAPVSLGLLSADSINVFSGGAFFCLL